MIRLVLLGFLIGITYLWWHYPHRFGRDFWRRWLMPGVISFLALIYAASPIDLIPDFTPFGFIDDLIVIVTAFLWVRQQLQKFPVDPHAPRDEPRSGRAKQVPWDPYAVLGIRRGASRAQVTQAYREQMKLYHPDRVAELGEDLQRVAHQKTIEIQRAYEELQ